MTEMSNELVPVVATPITTTAEYLSPVMNLETARRRLEEFQAFVRYYLRDGEDYGIIPGTEKPTLLKPGADKLCELYGLADTYPENRIRRLEDWTKDPPLFDYEVCCVLTHKATGVVIGEGLGSCNSYESKYRWREGQRICPQCMKTAIVKGKKEYGGGWVCFKKKGGCGAKFEDNDPNIIQQSTGRVSNPDIADVKNTCLKMAEKRAKVFAIIAATRSSGIFTQDVEDLAHHEETAVVEMAPESTPKSRKAPAQADVTLKNEPPILPAYIEASMAGYQGCKTLAEAEKYWGHEMGLAKKARDAKWMTAVTEAKIRRKEELKQEKPPQTAIEYGEPVTFNE